METHGSQITGMEGIRLEPRAAAGFKPGGFWRRFVALIVDQCIVGIIVAPLNIVLMIAAVALSDPASLDNSPVMGMLYLVYYPLYFVIIFFYYGWFYNKKGATPGKMLLSLKVVEAQTGTHLSYWRTFWRETVGKFLSFLTLMIGYIMVGFREDKKALHDLLFGTQVIRRVG